MDFQLSPYELLENPPTKYVWKRAVNEKLVKYWKERLASEALKRLHYNSGITTIFSTMFAVKFGRVPEETRFRCIKQTFMSNY